MDERNPASAWPPRVFDAVLKAVPFLIVLLWITGGFALKIGAMGLSLRKSLPVMVLLAVLIPLRWFLARFWSRHPFGVSARLKWCFMRLLELGIAVHLVMIPVLWNSVDFYCPFFSPPGLARSLGLIILMLLIRLVMGRNLAGLTVVISVFFSLSVVLFGLEVVLRTSASRQLRPQEAEIDNAVTDSVLTAKPEAPDQAATGPQDHPGSRGEDPFDPTRNDEVRWTWGHEIVNNRYGFREEDFDVPKPEGLFRIMILGDSLTWGAGLAPRDRYTDRLEEMLSRAVPGQPVEVINFGYQGGPTVRECDLLEDLHQEVDPDLIVVGFCLNDPQPRSMNYSRERERLDDLYSLIAGLRHVGLKKTYSFVINSINNVFVNIEAIPSWEEALDRAYQADSREWKEFERALGDIRRISDQRKLSPPVLILLVQGMARDNPHPPFMPEWFAKAGAAAARMGFVVVDPTSRFLAELTMKDLPVNPLDGHPSAVCNRIYADQLFEKVLPLVQEAGGR